MKKDIQSTENIVDEILSTPKEETSTPQKRATPAPKPETSATLKNADADKIEILPITSLKTFKSHPFKITENEDFNKLMDSIKENGIINPAIARLKDDGYELIAGHRRKAVCEKLGIETMPVVVRDMTDEQSTIFMVDSNVQRENILPSEKAFAYKMKMDALKRQGQRTDLSSSPVVSKMRTDEKLGLENGESREQVRRYIRLTELNPQLLQMVDEGKIAFRPAVELSFLTKAHQKLLLSAMDAEQSTPSLAQAQKIKMYSLEGLLDENKVTALMREQKPNQRECIRIPYDKVREILKKDMPIKAIEDFIFKAMTDYQRKLQQQRSADAR